MYVPLLLAVVLLGDVNDDRDVDWSDLSYLSGAYGSRTSQAKWDSQCELKGDKVGLSDLFNLGKNYGRSLP